VIKNPVPGQLSTLKKKSDLNKFLTLARDVVTWYWSVDTLFWQLSINHNTDEQYQRRTYVNGAILIFKVLGLAHGQSRDNQNF